MVIGSKSIIIFGAGKIGRSFIGQIFFRNGYRVVYVDTDSRLIRQLNEAKRYCVATLHNDGSRDDYWVDGIEAVDGRDQDACLRALSQGSLVATSVGARALPAVCGTLAKASRKRVADNLPLFDVIMAENIPDAVSIARACFSDAGLSDEECPGMIAASVGKTAPDVPAEELERDPLVVHADSYNTLIVSKIGWRNDPPLFPELYLTDSIDAYVKRKLFIHNLAHCAFAYLGYRADPAIKDIHQAMKIPAVYEQTLAITDSVARALALEYPREFDADALVDYRDGALKRIANPSIRDSIWRVGRDIARKLGRGERIVGSLLLTHRHNLPIEHHIDLYAAALSFRAYSDRGDMYAADEAFHRDILWSGISYAVNTISLLSSDDADEAEIIKRMRQLICYQKYNKGGYYGNTV